MFMYIYCWPTIGLDEHDKVSRGEAGGNCEERNWKKESRPFASMNFTEQ